jgi:hypothetical protein
MSTDYRDITITVDEQRSTVSILYKGGGGLHLPYKKLTIEYPSLYPDAQGVMTFQRKEVCNDRG